MKLEIERKYLIAPPERRQLDRLCTRRDLIRQTYLLSEKDCVERVRLRGCGVSAEYTHCIKRRRSALCREESETRIDAAEYRRLLLRADPTLNPIEKTRWCIPFAGHILEIDCYPFWADRAVLEVELEDETEEIRLPEWIRVIKEVTDDNRYTNRALAAELPYDAIGGETALSPTLRSWVELRLDRLELNYRSICAALPQGSLCMGMMKANAYGHGAVEAAARLEAAGCRYMAVACLEEGIQLRRSGCECRILVLGPTPAEWVNTLVKWNLMQTVSSLEQAKDYSRRLSAPLTVHAKIDSGMSRTGFPYASPVQLAEAMCLPLLQFEGVFTHFAAADEADGAEFTAVQHSRFTEAYAKAEALSGRRFLLHHCSNSGAFLTRPEFSGELVRPGLMLYGLYPIQSENAPVISPVMSLRSRVAAVTVHHVGDTVGYGRHFTCTRETRLAVLPIGYADGLPRALSGRFSVLLRGERAMQVGNICMDMCMVDVTDIPEVRVGDVATVFGDGASALELADIAGTIPYELLCAPSPRLPRVYLG